jgi:hypothetical protein
MASDVRTKPRRGESATDSDTSIDPGSFRDPAGRIMIADGRIFRTVSPTGWPNFETLMESGVLDAMIDAGKLWPAKLAGLDEVPPAISALAGNTAARIVEHPVLPFVSYP